MQTLKLKGWIDQQGQLHIKDFPSLPEGKVELVIWQVQQTQSTSEQPKPEVKTSVKAFQDLFEGLEPVPLDFDPDQAKWEALKEKHNL